MNYFELFGLPVSYDLSVGELKDRYRDLQRAFHPDRYAAGSQSEKLLAMQKATEINDAFATLKSSVERAEYMLKLAGLDISHETTTLKDPAFLMQQMEYREHLEEIQNLSDPLDEIMAFEDQLAEEHQNLVKNISVLLAQDEHQKAAAEVRKLKFIEKLQAELERLEDQAS
ncbi:co-chaperone HscB [Gayadomonas joobiniege]|uniref:co-chaperone HscB n=1 Tax=Gayadomonas joobiniege TaxID=1234606 RepID=UPI00036F8A20|nr:co-chaperone HscB [Gayadomonas joobiniege]